jgi:hypothetical protein
LSQVHAMPTDVLTVPAPKRSYSPGLTKKGGSLRKGELGCVEAAGRWLQQPRYRGQHMLR